MELKGRIINNGKASGEAFVLEVPFSFIGDFDPATGEYVAEGHPLCGRSIAGKILVCPSGKGGTIAPFIAFDAKKHGTAPAGILCEQADPILCESAIVIDIPLLDRFTSSPVAVIKTGDPVVIDGPAVRIG